MSQRPTVHSADQVCLIEATHRLVGRDEANAVQAAFGGTTIYVPNTVLASNPLTRIVGMEGMRRIAREFAGCHIHIPKGDGRAEWHRQLVLLLSLARLRVQAIALITDLTERHVFTIRRQLRADGELSSTKSKDFSCR